ncbi:MAG TPA: type II CAAX endopeptidase family protein [Rhodopila sp.]|nr:type II CAAX endopeptidase family protein [Rhodopila sp.]
MESIIDGTAPYTGGMPTPWRLLRRALAWMLLALAAVFVVALFPIIIDGLWRVIKALRHQNPGPPADFSTFLPYTAIALQLVLLWGAIRGADAVSPQNRAAGLADRPVSRRGLVGLFAVLLLIWEATAIGTLAWIVMHGGHIPKLPQQLAIMPRGLALALLHIVFLAVLAPVCEELFFRGWLWTALRTTWSPTRTATWTTGMWLAMHLMDGTGRALLLLPTGILLALARHYGKSVRASLALHLMNNGLVVVIQLAVVLLAGHSAPA